LREERLVKDMKSLSHPARPHVVEEQVSLVFQLGVFTTQTSWTFPSSGKASTL